LGPTVDCCTGRNLTGVSSFTSFALFPKLPAELRVQIWEVPIPRPKIRRFSPQDFSLSGGNKTVYYRPLFQHEDSENCTPVLRACKESREVALRLLPAKLPSVCQEAVRDPLQSPGCHFHTHQAPVTLGKKRRYGLEKLDI
jgi:hypothetical protein